MPRGEDASPQGVSPSDLLDGETPPPPEPVTGEHDAGVRALMRAVLLDAIGCLSGEGIKPSHRARVAMQARAWFARRGRDSLFTFDSICDVLGLDGERLRDRLHVAGGSRKALLATTAASPDDRDGEPGSSSAARVA